MASHTRQSQQVGGITAIMSTLDDESKVKLLGLEEGEGEFPP